MQLIQILLPLYDNKGVALAKARFKEVQGKLTRRFHGLTAYSRVAAEGHWRTQKKTKRDDIVVYEVMAPSFELKWWRNYQRTLQKSFRQDRIVIRAQKIRVP